MTTDPPAGAAPPPNVAALVDAIDARAKQAGEEGATTVLQRMLGSVTDVLGGIQDRLDRVEELLHRDGGAGASGAGGTVEAVTAGLAAFNARLSRLEEAFVQAVDESGSGTQAVVDEVRSVVVRALEESAPAAAGEAAALDPVTRDALVRVEASLAQLTAARDERPAQEVVGLALAAMDERLDALEGRLVATVEAHLPKDRPADVPATVDVSAALAPMLERLARIEDRLAEVPRSAPGTMVEDAFELVQVRIAGLEQLMRVRASERVDVTAPVRAAMAPVIERMDAMDAAHRSAVARQSEGLARVDSSLAALPGRLTSLEERVWAVVTSLTDGVGASVDATVLTRLEEAVERLERDESSARLVRLVEERMSAGLRAVTERTDEVRRSLEQFVKAASSSGRDDDGALDDVVASLRLLHAASSEVPDAVAAAVSTRLGPLGDRLGGLDTRLDGLEDVVRSAEAAVATVRSRVDELVARRPPEPSAAVDTSALVDAISGLRAQVEELAARPQPEPVEVASTAPDTSALVEQITAAVRRESELLTQRVAALAVGVEAARVLLEQQAQVSENTIGRKAGDHARRLAADFGIRTKRSAPGGRGGPRELGSG